MYEVEAPTLHADELRFLVEALRPLNIRQVAGEAYHTTDAVATQALYQPLLADKFREPWVYAQVATLWPGQALNLHTDGQTGRKRRHVVLQTNPACWVHHGGDWQQLEAGGIYRMDPMQPHAAVNWGTKPRMHLFFDVEGT